MGYFRTGRLAMGDYNSCTQACSNQLNADTAANNPEAAANYSSCTSTCETQYPQGEVAGSSPAPGTASLSTPTTSPSSPLGPVGSAISSNLLLWGALAIGAVVLLGGSRKASRKTSRY